MDVVATLSARINTAWCREWKTIDIPCLWPPAFSTAWHCAHLVLKIFSPDLAFPLGASPNVAMVQVKTTTCTYITFGNAVSLTFKISRRYCIDFLAYVDWQSLWLILPIPYKILLTKQASNPPSILPFPCFLSFFIFRPGRSCCCWDPRERRRQALKDHLLCWSPHASSQSLMS